MKRAVKRALCDPGPELRAVATGCLSLDWALGHGGFPRGHLLEIFGPPDSGKTTLGLEAIAAVQSAGGVAAFLDAEHALNSGYACDLGVDTASLIYSQPTEAPQALEIMRTLVKTCAVDVIVLDSVAALGSGASSIARPGYAIRHGDFDYWPFVNGLRELHALIQKSPCCVIFLNQLRSRLGVEIGSSETTPGAPALHCFASIRVRVERRATLATRGEAVGIRCALRVMKNSLGQSGRQAEFHIQRCGGISREVDLLTLGRRAGVILRTSAGLSFGPIVLGGNFDEAAATLRANPQLRSTLDAELRDRAGFRRKRALSAIVGS